jgi:hypothetical protein
VLVMVAVPLAVFGATLGMPFVWDDVALLQRNDAVRHLDLGAAFGQGLWSSVRQLEHPYFRPVGVVAFQLAWQLGQGQPWAFHLLVVGAHLLNGVLLLQVLRRLLGAVPGARSASLLGALLFALHPTRVGAVAWASGAFDVLLTTFVLAAVLLAVTRPASWARTASLVALAFLAAGTKEVGVALGAVLLGLWPLLPPLERRRAAVDAGLCVVVALALHALRPPTAGLHLLAAPLVALEDLGLFTWRLVLPFWSNARYLAGAGDVPGTGAALAWAAGLVVGVALLLRWLATPARWLALVVLAVPLAPPLVAHATGVATDYADRYAYLPFVGLSVLLALALRQLGPRAGWLTAVALLALAPVTALETQAYASDDALNRLRLRRDPHDSDARWSLAYPLTRRSAAARLAVARFTHAGALPPGERYALAVLVGTLVAQTMDAEPEAMADVARFLDGLEAPERPEVSFSYAGGTLTAARPDAAPPETRERVRQARARAHARSGDLEGALALLRGPAHPADLVDRRIVSIYLLTEAHQAARARAVFNELRRDAPSKAPGEIDATVTRLQALLEMPEGAARTTGWQQLGCSMKSHLVARALSEEPLTPELLRAQVQLELCLGRPDRARAELEAALPRFPQLRPALEEGIASLPATGLSEDDAARLNALDDALTRAAP